MSLLHPSPQAREALHDHVFYGAVTLTLLVFGSGVGTALGYVIRAGALG